MACGLVRETVQVGSGLIDVAVADLGAEQREVLLLGQRFDALHEVGGDLLEIARLDPVDVPEALEQGAEHADGLHFHDVAPDAHAVDQGIFQGDVGGEPFG
jgi:hypothetical protein